MIKIIWSGQTDHHIRVRILERNDGAVFVEWSDRFDLMGHPVWEISQSNPKIASDISYCLACAIRDLLAGQKPKEE